MSLHCDRIAGDALVLASRVARAGAGSRKCTASTGIAVGTSTAVRYSEEVRYWEGPLSEVPLYTHIHARKHDVGCGRI